MNNIKFLKKTLALILTAIMVLSAIPLSAILTNAATEANPNSITVTVVDEDNNPIENANVAVVINSIAKGDNYVKKDFNTDNKGCVEVMPSTDFAKDDLKISAEISKDEFKTDNSTIKDKLITSADEDFKVTLMSSTIKGITVTPYDNTYDDAEHLSASFTGIKDGDRVSLKLDDGDWNTVVKTEQSTVKAPLIKDAKSYTLQVEIERDGYSEPYKTTVYPKIGKASINNISIKANELSYNGNEQELVTLTGSFEENDKVTWTVNTKDYETKDIPTEMAVGDYNVSLSVERGNNYYYNSGSISVSISNGKLDLAGLKITPFSGTYTVEKQSNGEYAAIEREVVDVENKGNYELQYQIDSGDNQVDDSKWSTDIPKIFQAGEYTVWVKATKDSYNDSEIMTYTAVISKADQTIKFNTDYKNGGTSNIDLENKADSYDFSVVSTREGYGTDNASQYSVNDSDVATINSDGQLEIKKAGIVNITVEKAGNNNINGVTIEHTLIITSNNNLLKELDDVSYTLNANNAVVSKNKAAKENDDDNGELTYDIVNYKENCGLKIDKETGEVTVADYDALTKVMNGEEYSFNVNVEKSEGTKEIENIYFSNTQGWENVYIYYWTENSNNSWPGVQMDYKETNEYGEKVYSKNIPTGVTGIVFNGGKNGPQTVDITSGIDDKAGFYPTNSVNNKFEVGTYKYSGTDNKEIIYGEASVSYEVTINFAETPANPYSISGTKGNDGWYTSEVDVSPAEDYSISKTATDFSDKVTFGDGNDQGTDYRYIQLKDTEDGITAPIKIAIKIDNEKPYDVSIEYDTTNLISTVLETITFGFYKPSVTITFKATDTTSGVDRFKWKYTACPSIGGVISADNTDSATVDEIATNDEASDNSFTAQITLTADEAKQYCGKISVVAVDKAGNISDTNDDSYVFVVDTIAPTTEGFTIVDSPVVDNKHYFMSDATATLTIVETNFDSKDVKIEVSKDGGKNWTQISSSENTPNISLDWDDNTATITIKALADNSISMDGEYILRANYTDKAGNEMVECISNTIGIDTTAPTTDGFTIADSPVVDNKHYFKSDATATLTIEETNFDSSDVIIEVSKNSENWTQISSSENTPNISLDWDDNTATITIKALADNSISMDGEYILRANYTDKASNEMVECTSNTIIIDTTAPTCKVKYDGTYEDYNGISYYENKKNNSIGVDVEITEKNFDSDNVKVSIINDSTNGSTTYSPDINWTSKEEENDKHYCRFKLDFSTFTDGNYQIKIEYTDMAGNKMVIIDESGNDITEESGNKNGTYTSNIKVIDKTAPTTEGLKIADSPVVDNKHYFKSDATAKLTIKETNFYSSDVIIEVSKNSGKWTRINSKNTPNISLKWNNDTHNATITIKALNDHSMDGDYSLRANYTDKSKNKMVTKTSEIIVIDTTTPIISVKYDVQTKSTLKDSENHNRMYFDKERKATITITEHNFYAKDVEFSFSPEDVTGKDLFKDSSSLKKAIVKSAWKNTGDKHTMTITYKGDANYTFDINYTDPAKNNIKNYSPDYFTVDKTKPVINKRFVYSDSDFNTMLNNISFGFYQTPMTVTLSATDNISPINAFKTSSDASGYINATLKSAKIVQDKNSNTATTKFTVPNQVAEQFKGRVNVIASDRSGNDSADANTKGIIVDNIKPEVEVSFNNPINEENNVSYYNGKIDVSIQITEANFSHNDVNVYINDSRIDSNSISWNGNDYDDNNYTHTGTFTLSSDGDYTIKIDYTDHSGNKMDTYTSNKKVIDTKFDRLKININGEDGNGKAYKGDVIPNVSFADKNYDSYDLTLTRTRLNEKNKVVTDTYCKKITTRSMGAGLTGGNSDNDTFTLIKTAENDGIYTLKVSAKDKALNSDKASVTFTLNRKGSVYTFNKSLNSLIKNGGAYEKSIKSDLVITEYNADKLTADSLNIEITKDGKPVSKNAQTYSIKPVINNKVKIGSSGWYQYAYTVSKDNFKSDGTYKINISSKDNTGNDNLFSQKEQEILFHVDSTPADITSITGLESNVINAEKVTVKYMIYDTIGIKSAKVYLNGKEESVLTSKDFADDMQNYSGNIVLNESSQEQTFRIVVTDMAGNVTDTSKESFNPKYDFCGAVTISTNIFVRWFANKVLFFGSIGGVIVIVGGIATVVGLKRRKKNI